MLSFYFFFLFFIPQNNGSCGCSPAKAQNELYRPAAKYEKDFSKYREHAGIITSETVRSWEKIYKSKANKIFENSPRMKQTPEDSVYTLAGYIYHAHINANDCDLHLEIGTSNPVAFRTVAEIVKDSCKLQEQVIRQLKEKGFVMDKQNTKGIKCIIKGLGFYDGKHPLKKNKKYEKGSAWEIHPVISIELE
jgi:hypothetical protein